MSHLTKLLLACVLFLSTPAYAGAYLTGSGDPNGHQGCQAVTDLYLDSVADVLWVCSVPGHAATATWVAASGAASSASYSPTTATDWTSWVTATAPAFVADGLDALASWVKNDGVKHAWLHLLLNPSSTTGGINEAIVSCGEGSTTDDQGCTVQLQRLTRTITTTVTIGSDPGDADLTGMQNGITLRGHGAGFESSGNDKLCGSTLAWGGANGGTILQVSGSNLTLEDFCIEGNAEAGYGIKAVSDNPLGGVTTHGVMQNIRIEDVLDTTNASTGWAIQIQGQAGAGSDTDQNDFWTITNVAIHNSRHCLRQDSSQAFINRFEAFYCSEFTVSPAIDVVQGGVILDTFFIDPAVDGATGILVRSCGVNQVINNGVWEWDQDDGTFIKFSIADACQGSTSYGNQMPSTIAGNRFLIQDTPTVEHTCIETHRRTNFIIQGNTFSSDDAARSCDFEFDNDDTGAAVQASILMLGNDYQFNDASTEYSPSITVASSGGGLIRVLAMERGKFEILGPSISLALSADSNGAWYNADNDQTRDTTEGGIASYTHATDCTALAVGGMGDTCFEQDANDLFVCEPTAGGCDTAGEWSNTTP